MEPLNIFLGEFLGAALLITLGCGVVANTILTKSGMKHGAPSVQITFGWGFAVMLPVFTFAGLSGAHFNPAVTLGQMIVGNTTFAELPIYLIGQFGGTFTGAVIVWALFKDHLDENEDVGAKLGVFSTGPSVPNPARNVLSEIAGTFILVFALMGIDNTAGIPPGLGFVFVWAIIVSIGMSLGGLTGYAINPARDWGPRIAHSILPIKNKGDSNWGYAWVTMVGPLVGGALAALLFSVLPF